MRPIAVNPTVASIPQKRPATDSFAPEGRQIPEFSEDRRTRFDAVDEALDFADQQNLFWTIREDMQRCPW
ncbi:hypothetical protein [Mesorhizobium sp.]|uniref:hypothetical protein n=1 Tax=Mesorhizobium sp. TaxID=1871066 RepID=UPI000FE32A2F|nr:hypothetical protein [Mesorhizobium sp.]RWN50459.1 MAG: hypothetical protein EOR98_31400 [Mesorhizobium sp.]RWN70900.1 MAG: hypothetical protein EOS01_32370 [Mesorhizobium sp.]RWN70945.1 MAG: hypothetical protein EOS02_32450 [Mesorhizobium sp.]RWN82450.1 MAG: hypothetical protein EOS04_31105 [Mesorhizobium sp.]RWO09932.1 MAG: hypothetical protein EOS15_25995 [Mesorhizobium sp.]